MNGDGMDVLGYAGTERRIHGRRWRLVSAALLVAALPVLMSAGDPSPSADGVARGHDDDQTHDLYDDGTSESHPRDRGDSEAQRAKDRRYAPGYEGTGEPPEDIRTTDETGSDELDESDEPELAEPDEPEHDASGDFSTQSSHWGLVSDDDRLAYPRRTVTRVYFDDLSGDGMRCTGWMLESDRVITNAHCLYDRGQSEWYPRGSYTVQPAAHGSETPYGSCNVTRRVIPSNYDSIWPWHDPHDWDYGAMALDCSVGNNTGWMGFWWSSIDPEDDARARRGAVTGYPNAWMHEGIGDITSSTNQQIFFDNPSAAGMSGSGRWNQNNTSCGSCVHGILRDVGQGVRINDTVFDQIARWKHEW